MREFTIIHKTTNVQKIIFGYWYEDACSRSKLNPNDWEVILVDFID